MAAEDLVEVAAQVVADLVVAVHQVAAEAVLVGQVVVVEAEVGQAADVPVAEAPHNE